MTSLSDFTATTLTGQERHLSDYAGQVVLVVNTASACGLTPQYEGLEALYQELHGEGLVVLGFPCNQFGSQEPGTAEEIGEFCPVNYGVSFPMFAKIDVNGEDAHPLFVWLKDEKKGLLGGKDQVELHQVPPRPRRPGHRPVRPHHRAQGHRRRHPCGAGHQGCMSPWLVLVPIGVLAGFLAFVWQRLAVAPGWRPRWVRHAVALVLLALTALTFAGFDVWGGWFTPAQLRPAVWVGQAFLATCLYLFLGLVPVWLVCVGIWLARRRHDHGRVVRQRLNRVASPLVAVVAVAVTAYGAVEAAHPSITRFEVASPQLPAEFAGARVALITDLHAGAVRSASFTRQVVDLVNAEHPDLVVIAGDTVDGTAERYAPEIAPLADLEAPLGVYAVTGNHEMYRDTANWLTAFQGVRPPHAPERGRAGAARRRQHHPRGGARPHRRG